jgi:hypothetical protein
LERWVVYIDDRQLAQLNHEQRELGTLLSNDRGEHFLVFRDAFVALKIASSIGAKRSPGRSLPASTKLPKQPLARFANGDVLVGEG